MHNKIFFTVFVLLILGITLIGLNADTSVKKIGIRNQSFNVRNEKAKISNSDVDISFGKTKLKNKDINSETTAASVQNANISKVDTNFNSSKIETNNTEYTGIKAANKLPKARYMYKNISWNEWKSNFINQVLEDTSSIETLDNYGLGTWFYYSFDVMNDGSIKNIRVYSFYLKNSDVIELIRLIKRYEKTEITVFPQNSKRKKAKIDAIVVLSNEEVKSAPTDFHDSERVKIQY